jgi:5-methylcytosine-specific restriction endonuclease McrA
MNLDLRLDSVTDDDLLSRTTALVATSRRVEAELVAHLAEVDARELYLREACPSMFVYATTRLGLSEAEAYLRIHAGRAARRFPMILDLLAAGRIHLSAIAKLSPHLSEENVDRLLARAAGRSKREIDVLVAELVPKPDAPALIRRVPVARGPQLRPDGVVRGSEIATAADSAPIPPSVSAPVPALAPAQVAPLAPARFKVQFTASAELEGKLARARALLRHQVPDGDLAAIVDRAVTLLVRELEREKCAATEKPRRSLAEADVTPRSRHIPAPVRRAVWKRDGAQCTYVDEQGRRCPARELLEFHHVAPFARGGDHDPSNIRLLCRSHNRYQAEIDFGREVIERQVDASRRSRGGNRSRVGERPLTWVSGSRDYVARGRRLSTRSRRPC